MTIEGENSAERVFLHDICNVIAVAQGNLYLIVRGIKKKPDEVKMDELVAKIEASLASITKLTEMVNHRRAVIKGEIPAA